MLNRRRIGFLGVLFGALSGILFGVLLAPAAASTAPAKTPPSIEQLAALPAFAAAELSRSGDRLAYFGKYDGHRTLIILSLTDRDQDPFVVTGENWRLNQFDWLDDNRVLLWVSIPEVRERYTSDRDAAGGRRCRQAQGADDVSA